MIGIHYLEQGFSKEAERHFRQSIKNDPTTMAHAMIGLAYLAQDDRKKTDSHLRHVIRGPDRAPLRMVARAYGVMGVDELAIPYYERLIELDPTDLGARLDLAHLYALTLYDYEAAQREL